MIVVEVTGQQFDIRPSKIVAGHEADKTNLFLQTLAYALQNQVKTTLHSRFPFFHKL